MTTNNDEHFTLKVLKHNIGTLYLNNSVFILL